MVFFERKGVSYKLMRENNRDFLVSREHQGGEAMQFIQD
jgi:hypothetical protein